MASAKWPSVFYDKGDAEFLEHLGLADPDGDGVVSSREIRLEGNRAFRDFYATLTPGERALFNGFTQSDPLRAARFAGEAELSRLALKYLAFSGRAEIIETQGFPAPEEVAENLDFTLDPRDGDLFSEITVDDIASLRAGLSDCEWGVLTDPGISPAKLEAAFPTLTIFILRDLLARHFGETAFKITRGEWEEAFARQNCRISRPDTAESTWNEFLLLWIASASAWEGPLRHVPWHAVFWPAADTLLDWTSGGFAALARPDNKVTAKGLKAYLNAPDDFTVRAHEDLSPPFEGGLQAGVLRTTSRWPARPTRIVLNSVGAAGVSLVETVLETEPGATVSTMLRVDEGKIRFSLGQPLLKLDGFHLNLVSEGATVTKVKSYLPFSDSDFTSGTWLEALPDLDYENFTPAAVSVFDGRLCLVMTGDAGSNELMKPLDADTLLLDIGPFVRLAIGADSPFAGLEGLFFDASGRLVPGVALGDLAELVRFALEESSVPAGGDFSPASLPAADEIVHEVLADGVRADLSGFLPQINAGLPKSPKDKKQSIEVTDLEVTGGRLAGRGRHDSALRPPAGDWTLEGRLDLEVGLSAPDLGIPSDLYPLEIVFHYDALVSAGYARVKIPPVSVAGVSRQADGTYDGEILVGISLEDFRGTESDGELAKEIAARAVAEVRKNGADFLVASVRLNVLEESDAVSRVQSLLVDNDVALFDETSRVYGILCGGTFTEMKVYDANNAYLSHYFDVTGQHAVLGGLTQFFGDGVALQVRLENDGTYRVKPLLDRGRVSQGYELGLSDIGGELVIEPVRDAAGAPSGYVIRAENLKVTIPNVELQMKDGARAKASTHAILSGVWESQAPNLLELLLSGRDWIGKGRLVLNRSGETWSVEDAKGQTVTVVTDEAETVFEIDRIEFYPVRGDGRLTETVKSGEVYFDHPKFYFYSDVEGAVTMEGRYSFVRMHVLSLLAEGAWKQPARPSELIEKDEDAVAAPADLRESPEAIIKELLGPLVSVMENSSLLQVDPAFFVSEEFPWEALCSSFVDLDVALAGLPVAPGIDYKKRGDRPAKGRYPAFHKGPLALFNPRVAEGTRLLQPESQALLRDGQVRDLRFDLTDPVSFLGFRVAGVGLETKNPDADTGSGDLHVFVYTASGKRFDLMKVLRLAFPRRIRRLYESLGEQGVVVGRNGVPRDFKDWAPFIRGLIDVFELEEKARAQAEKEMGPFKPGQFRKLDAQDMQRIWESLVNGGPPLDIPEAKNAKTLAAYLNAIAASPEFTLYFVQNLGVFDAGVRAQAFLYLNEIQRLERLEAGGAVEGAEREATITAYKNKILRLYLKPLMPEKDFFDLDAMSVAFSGTALPKQADYAWFEFTEDAEKPVDLAFAYEAGAVRVRAANGEGQALEHVSVDLLAPEFLVRGDVASLHGLDLMISPPQGDELGQVELSFGAYDVSNLTFAAIPKTSFKRPSVAIFPSASSPGNDNRATGSGLTLRTYPEEQLYLDLNIGDFDAKNGYVYFSTPLRDKTGAIVDNTEVLASLAETDFDEVTVTVTPRETPGREPNDVVITGGMDINPLPGAMPRLILYAGAGEYGERRYVEVKEIVTSSDLRVENGEVAFTGYASVLAVPPAGFRDAPALRELREMGVDVNVEEAWFEGTFAVNVSGGEAGITRAPGREGRFEPTVLNLYGSFTFEFNGSRVTVSHVVVPVEKFAMEVVVAENETAAAPQENAEAPSPESKPKAKAVIKSVEIPAGESVSGFVAGEIVLPPQYEIDKVRLNNAHVELTPAGGLAFGIENGDAPVLSAPQGVDIHVEDAGSKNVIDLGANVIRYEDGAGVIREWTLDAELSDVFSETLVTIAARGLEARLGAKDAAAKPAQDEKP